MRVSARAVVLGRASTLLPDREVVVAERRDLRQVRHAQHLPRLAETTQQPPDDLGDGAADAAVDFVEDQRRHASSRCSRSPRSRG